MALDTLNYLMAAIAAEVVPCTANADCTSYFSTAPGVTSPVCVDATAMPTGVSSICSFACSAEFALLDYTTDSSYVVARTCFDTVVPVACSTTTVSGTSSDSTCSTPTASATPFPTATYAIQHCRTLATISALGGGANCRALCPQSYTLTTSDTAAYCTLTTTTDPPASTETPSSSSPKITAPPSSTPPTGTGSDNVRSTISVLLDCPWPLNATTKECAGTALKPSRWLLVLMLLIKVSVLLSDARF